MGQHSARHCAGERCIESIEPRLASTTSEPEPLIAVLVTERTMVQSREGLPRQKSNEQMREARGLARSNRSGSSNATFLGRSKWVAAVAVVDVEEKATVAVMPMTPAAIREGGHQPSVVDVG